jgi:hypothetical protein
MAFNTSGLSAYVENKSKNIAVQAVKGSATAKLLIDNNSFQSEVKGSHAILKMDVDVNLQDGSACGRTALGSVTLTDKTITVKAIKDTQNICAKTLYNTYYAQMVANGQNPEGETFDPAFLDKILELKGAKIANAVEVLLWQGDTLSGSANLNKIDGLLKQITAASDEITIAESGADVVAKLQSVFAAMPVQVRKQDDFRIFLGQDLYDSYVIAMANKNIYKPVEDFKLFGTTAILVPTPGLDSTNKVVAARISDLQFATDMVSEETKAVFKYSMETENWYLDYHFAVGVAAVHTSQIGIADFAS